jgi:hypothetical protein
MGDDEDALDAFGAGMSVAKQKFLQAIMAATRVL